MSATESTAVTSAVVEEVKQESTPTVVDTKTEEPGKSESKEGIAKKAFKTPAKETEVEAEFATTDGLADVTEEIKETLPAINVKAATKHQKIGRRLSARVGDFFKSKKEVKETPPAVNVKATTKATKISRRLSARVGDFFKSKDRGHYSSQG